LDVVFWGELILFAILLAFSAFFSSSEVSLFSLSGPQREQMRRDGNPRIPVIDRLLSEPRRLIVTILIGNEFVNVAASVISAAMVIQLLGAENKFINLFIMVPVLLLFGEITPKVLAMRNNAAFASYQSTPIETFARLIAPLRWLIRHIADYFITLIVGKERSRGNIITEDMIRSLAREAVGEGAMDQTEAEFIEQVFDFANQTLEDIHTPRADVHFISVDASFIEVLETVRSARQSRFPVYETHRDQVLGILHARDLLKLGLSTSGGREIRLRNLLRPAYFVPESKPAVEQFEAFRKRKRSFALTVDEYGGVTGVVTMEDLLECIFGDIPSPSDLAEEDLMTPLEGTKWSVDGMMPVEDFARALDAHFDDVVMETVGGLVLHELGELPSEGTVIDIGEFRFAVVAVENNRISRVIVEPRMKVPDTEHEPDSGPASETASEIPAETAEILESKPSESGER
jgi:putative hemolysin